MIARLKARYAEWKERRFLKKHGCDSKAQYERRYDPDYNLRATSLRDYYHGYPYWADIPYPHHAYQVLYDYGPGGWREGYHDIWDWCKEHCEDKFRIDFLRVIQNYSGEWEVNEIGGMDVIFIAFKNENDFLNYCLRWASFGR